MNEVFRKVVTIAQSTGQTEHCTHHSKYNQCKASLHAHDRLFQLDLRASEIAAFTIAGIDPDRMTILIQRAKGKKDRIVSLSQILLQELREYYKQDKPKKYLFEDAAGNAYSVRSMQNIFQKQKSRLE